MKVNNLELVCVLKPANVFSEKTHKSYPCVTVEFPDGSTCNVFDSRLLTSLFSSIYFNQKGGDAN